MRWLPLLLVAACAVAPGPDPFFELPVTDSGEEVRAPSLPGVEDADYVIEWTLRRTDSGEIMQAPVLAIRTDDRAHLSIAENFRYIRTFEWEEVNGHLVADPLVGTLETGLRVDAVVADGVLHYAITITDADTPMRTRELPLGTAVGTIELPSVLRTVVESRTTIVPGRTLALARLPDHLELSARVTPQGETVQAAPAEEGWRAIELLRVAAGGTPETLRRFEVRGEPVRISHVREDAYFKDAEIVSTRVTPILGKTRAGFDAVFEPDETVSYRWTSRRALRTFQSSIGVTIEVPDVAVRVGRVADGLHPVAELEDGSSLAIRVGG